jgi:hypothetical protein
VATILQSVIGGSAELFRVLPLGGRVFRFSVSSRVVGFHIYGLRSFDCSSFKVFFNLWHGGGPNYIAEFRRWEAEEQAKWTTVQKHNASSSVRAPPLTGANSIPVSNSSHGHRFQISNPVKSFTQSIHHAVINRFNGVTKSHLGSIQAIKERPGILGKYSLHSLFGLKARQVSCSRCLA